MTVKVARPDSYSSKKAVSDHREKCRRGSPSLSAAPPPPFVSMRSRSSNRRKSTLNKVSVKPKNKKKTPRSERFQNSSLEYDSKATQFANYQRLGLMADANQIGAKHDTVRVTGFNPRVKGARSSSADLADDQAPHPLELECPEGLKVIRKVPLGERNVLLKLIAAHGDDHGAMARDMRLNQLQHTAAHLRKRIAKMREEEEEDRAAAQEAATAGAPAPPDRFARKRTRDPNNAFAKRSRHFL